MNINKFIIAFTILLLCGCVEQSKVGSGGGGSITSAQATLSAPPKTFLKIQPHIANSAYYTDISNAPYYIALTVENKSMLQQNIAINLSDSSNSFSIVPASANNLYPNNITTCSGSTIGANQTCEILIQLNNPQSGTQQTAQLSVTLGSVTITKTLIQNPIAYIAGDVATVLNSNGSTAIASQPYSGVNNACGGNSAVPGAAWCQVFAYNMVTNAITPLATTDGMVSGMTIDDDGILYLGGSFSNLEYGSTTITQTSNQGTLIAELNPAYSGGAEDFIQSAGAIYPNNPPVGVMSYANGSIYMSGGFTAVGTYVQSSSMTSSGYYPVVAYNLNNQTWSNALGNDNNNPNGQVLALTFDNSSDMLITGAYNKISGNTFGSDPTTSLPINKCTMSGGEYSCGTDGNSVANASGIVSGSLSPAPYVFALTVNPGGQVYAGGAFTTISGSQSLPYGAATSNTNNFSSWSLFYTPYLANLVGTMTAFGGASVFMTGLFSSVGSAQAIPGNGVCGPIPSYTSPCLLALTNGDGFGWSSVLGTDNQIASVVVSSVLVVQ